MLRGVILPRAIPAMSGMIASISVIRCCFRKSSMSCMSVLVGLVGAQASGGGMARVRAARRARQASPKARKIALDSGSCAWRHSGCHCTARAKAGASTTLTASIRPSGATASTASRSRAARCPACAASSRAPRRGRRRAQRAAGRQAHDVRGPYCVPSARRRPRGDRRGPALRARAGAAPQTTFSSWKPRQTASTARPRRSPRSSAAWSRRGPGRASCPVRSVRRHTGAARRSSSCR